MPAAMPDVTVPDVTVPETEVGPAVQPGADDEWWNSNAHRENAASETVTPYDENADDPQDEEADEPRDAREEPVTAGTVISRLEELGATVERDEQGEVAIIDLSFKNVANEDLSHISLLAHVEELNLTGTQVTDAGLVHLAGLDELESLWLTGTEITDASLVAITELTQLKALGLERTSIADEGLAHLSGLTELQFLLLGRTQISDAGLEHLKQLKALEGLSLLKCNVTQDGVDELRQSLPDCEIIFGDGNAQSLNVSSSSDAPKRLGVGSTETVGSFAASGLVDKDIQSIVDVLLEMAWKEHRDGRVAAAAERFRRIRRLRPNDSKVSRSLGRFYTMENEWALASEVLHVAVSTTPDDVGVRYDLAVALGKTGQFDEAMPHFVRTVGHAAAQYNMGVLLYELGQLEASEARFVRAIQHQPDFEEAILWLDEVRREQKSMPTRYAAPPVGSDLYPIQPARRSQVSLHNSEGSSFDPYANRYDSVLVSRTNTRRLEICPREKLGNVHQIATPARRVVFPSNNGSDASRRVANSRFTLKMQMDAETGAVTVDVTPKTWASQSEQPQRTAIEPEPARGEISAVPASKPLDSRVSNKSTEPLLPVALKHAVATQPAKSAKRDSRVKRINVWRAL